MISLISPTEGYLIEFERLVQTYLAEVDLNRCRWCKQMFELIWNQYPVEAIYCSGLSRIVLDNDLMIDCFEHYWQICGTTKQYKYLKRNLKYLRLVYD